MAGRIRAGFDLRDGLLLGGLVAVIVVMGLVGRVARRAIQEAAAKSKAAPGS